MQDLLESFGLSKYRFRDFLEYNNAVIAGSAPLSCYLESKNLPSFTPGDIDIWMKSPKMPKVGDWISFIGRIISDFSYFKYSVEFLAHKSEDWAYIEMEDGGTHIEAVISFVSEDKTKKVQLIIINIPVQEFIKTDFDLSCSAISWDPLTDEFHSDNFESINAMEMFVNETFINKTLTVKRRERQLKYKARGFKLVPNPK